MTSEFISGIFWGVCLALWIRVLFAGHEYWKRRQLMRKYPKGVLIVTMDKIDYMDAEIPLAKIHRDNPEIALIVNGREW